MSELVNKTKLDNGLTIVTETIPSVRSVSVGIWVKIGSRYETKKQAGVTHFLEHMLFKGTENRSAFDLVSQVESRGGFMNAFTSNEYTAYYIRCLDSELESALDILADMVLNPLLPKDEIEKEKKVVIEEMKMYRDSPDDYVFESFIKQIFKPHPLSVPIIGSETTVNAFSQDLLKSFVSDYYKSDNLIVSVAGNISHDKVVSVIDKLFSKHSSGTVKQEFDRLPNYEPTKIKLTKKIEQTHLVLGKRGLSSSHEDRFKLLLMNMLLGGGMSSRLHQNVREKYGYCYSIHSTIQSFYDTGLFAIYTGTDIEYVDHLKELIFNELDKLVSNPIDKVELSNAKTQLKGMLLLGQESTSNRMTRLAKSEMYYERYVPLNEIELEIEKVSPDILLDFSKDFLNKEQFTETVLVPSEND